MKGLLSLVCAVLLSLVSTAQFFNNPNILGFPIIRSNAEYGQGVTIYDVNLDGLDDLIFVQTNDSLLLFESTGSDFILHQPIYCDGESKQALFGDYDNDGDPDLLLTTIYNALRLFRNEGNWQFVEVTAEVGLDQLPHRQTFGASWGDINNDGWLDLFIANYNDGPIGSWLLMNNLGESFTDVSNQWGVNINSDMSFQGTFFDHNMDGKQDLHVANDRFPADALLINHNNDFFINETNSNGLNVPCDAMCSSIADYNHDGKYDIYVTNNPPGNKLWERNEFGFYTNVAEEKGVAMYRMCWGATWIDWNNDSWEDLFVNHFFAPNDPLPFFYNVSGTFVQASSVSNYPNVDSYASAKGDFNNDGYADMAVSTSSGSICRLLFNEGGDNHYIKFRLVGQASNKDGIGTHVRYVLNENASEELIRYTRAGDNYLSQDSQWYILGLGDKDTLPYLELNWLSGVQDVYTHLKSDTAYIFYEGFRELSVVSDAVDAGLDVLNICFDESTIIAAESELPVVWNDGNTESVREINTPGEYYYTTTDAFGIINTSNTFTLQVSEAPSPVFTIAHPSCTGVNDGVIFWTVNENWSQPSMESNAYSAGTYPITLLSNESCTFDTTIVLIDPPPLEVTWLQESIYDSIVQYSVAGGTPPYAIELPSGSYTYDSLYLAIGENLFSVEDINGCLFSTSIFVEQQLKEEEEEEQGVGLNEKPNVHSVMINHKNVALDFIPNTCTIYNPLGQVLYFRRGNFSDVRFPQEIRLFIIVFENETHRKVLRWVD